MTTAELRSETLTCSSCGHSITTSKTIDKPDSLEVKCPKCHQQFELGAWRHSATQSVQLQSEETASLPQPSNGIMRDYLAMLLQIGLFLTALCFGVVALIAAINVFQEMNRPVSSFDLFDSNMAPGKTANVIQRLEVELTIIRNLLIAFAFTKLTHFVVQKSQKVFKT